MFNDFEITLTGGYAIVTVTMWLFWMVVGLIMIYQSKFFKLLGVSFKVLIKPRRQR